MKISEEFKTDYVAVTDEGTQWEIAGFDTKILPSSDAKGDKKLIVKLKNETEEKTRMLTGKELRHMQSQLGDDTDNWLGKKVVVRVAVTNGQDHPVLRVV